MGFRVLRDLRNGYYKGENGICGNNENCILQDKYIRSQVKKRNVNRKCERELETQDDCKGIYENETNGAPRAGEAEDVLATRITPPSPSHDTQSHPKQMARPPTPFDPKIALLLPHLIPETKHRAPPPRPLHNPADRHLLLPDPRDCLPVRLSATRPPCFEVIRFQAGTDSCEDGELGGDEGAGIGGGDGGVEKGVDVCGCEVEHGAEGFGVLDEDAKGFGGGDGAVVAGGFEGSLRVGDERGERGGGAVVVEDGFVADDDHFDRGPGIG